MSPSASLRLAMVFGALLLCTTAPADARSLTPLDLATLDRVSDPHVSPDGRWVAYDLRTTDYAANTARHAIWLAGSAADSAPPRRLPASDGGATAPRWSADGRAIYFLSGRSGSDQVWKTELSGLAAVQVTNLPLDVGAFRLAPDGHSLVVAMAVFPDCATLDCTVQRRSAKAADKAGGKVFDQLFVRHWDTWADGTRNHLFSLALDPSGLAPGLARPLMSGLNGDTPSKPFGGDEDFDISRDGQSVYFSMRAAGRTEPWSTNFDIWRAPIDGGVPAVDLTAGNPAWDAEPAVSPDGRRLAYRAQTRPGEESDRFGLWVMDLETGVRREIAPGWDRSAQHITWSGDGRTLLATADEDGNAKLFKIQVASGAVTPVTAAGHVTDIDSAAGLSVYAQDSMSAPTQLFTTRLDGQPPRQLTLHDQDSLAGVDLAGYQRFAFPGWNGELVQGYVLLPPGHRNGQKHPVAFLIHGGPQGSWNNGWSYRWNPQTYTAMGFAVVVIDFHGSTGYGQAFTDSISQHWGDRPLEDLQKGWSWALAHYPALDGGRACALGASYGGYMINWIAGVWNQPWRCLVVHDGVFDSRMMAYSTEELWFSEHENGGLPWQHAAEIERFNPVGHVADWIKPQLVIHGGRDYRIPLEQGLGAFTALQRKGVPSRLLYFPEENHWVQKPQDSVQWHDTVGAWLKQWTSEPGRTQDGP